MSVPNYKREVWFYMRDKDGNVERVDSPEEFLEKFVGNSWEYDYIKEEERELLESWIMDYIRIKKADENKKIDK